MRSIRGTVTTIVLAVAVEALPAVAQDSTGTRDTKPALAVLYTEGQAVRGQDGFTRTCTFCHGSHDFSGQKFRTNWSGQSVESFYSFLRNSMPQDNPGRLTGQEYVDIVAYVLQLNGYPAGTKELPPDPTVLNSFQLQFDTAQAR
ncbi:MAG: cytochrome c [Gemmatimonadetes bacterium]|nr:cytochrome c [Gemmatimonadota bacterium]